MTLYHKKLYVWLIIGLCNHAPAPPDVDIDCGLILTHNSLDSPALYYLGGMGVVYKCLCHTLPFKPQAISSCPIHGRITYWQTSSPETMSFISRNIDKLIKDEAFVTDVIDSLHERGGRFFWAEDIVRLVLDASRDTCFAERLLRLSTMADRPRRLVEELINNNVTSLFDAGLRFRRSDDLKTFEWVETSATLAAGYVVGGR